MFRCHPSQRHGVVDMQHALLFGRDAQRTDNAAACIKGNHAPVEQGIEVGAKQEAVKHIQALLIAFALCPWLGVAGTENLGHVQAGHRAGPAPVVHERLAEGVLPDALLDQPLDLGGAVLDLGNLFFHPFGIGKGGLIGQRQGKFGCAPQEVSKVVPPDSHEGAFFLECIRKAPGQFLAYEPCGHRDEPGLMGCLLGDPDLGLMSG